MIKYFLYFLISKIEASAININMIIIAAITAHPFNMPWTFPFHKAGNKNDENGSGVLLGGFRGRGATMLLPEKNRG